MESSFDIFNALMKLSILVFSLCLHEFGHAFAAYRLGDPTAKMMGRLTLDPRAHVDPIGTLLFPLVMLLSPGLGQFLIGWAKPVPVTRENFRNPRRDDILVSVAGPAANILLFGVSLITLSLLARIGWFDGGAYPVFLEFLSFFLFLNFFLAVFNLLPIPPLDGSWVLKSLLPGEWSYRYSRLEPYGFMILLALLWTGLLGTLMSPAYLVLWGILGAAGLGGAL